jgi:hypothetical protein
MKHVKKLGVALFAATLVSLFTTGMSGCNEGKKNEPGSTPAMDQNKDAAQPHAPTNKPKDHPAH